MKFNEAIDAIGTTSSDTKGIKKRLGITRRKVPAGFVQTDYAIDQYSDDKERKDKKKKKRKDEGRRITRDDRPMYTGDWHRDFFRKGEKSKESIENDDEDDLEKDEAKLKELLMQVSGPRDQMSMDTFWDKGKKYDKDGNEIRPEDDEEDPEEDEVEETIGVTNFVDPHYSEKAMNPFWRKGKKHTEDEEESDDGSEEEAEEEPEEDED